jgi:metal-responsive CopG/Arc/MetJ family transcriptional regulator
MLTQTFNISLPKQLVQQADIVAKKEFKNRSELIKEALRTYLYSSQTWGNMFKYGSKMAQKAGINDEEDVLKAISDYRNGK